MPTVHRYTVRPVLPERIRGLQEVAYNLYWTWNPNAIRLLQRLDADLWEESRHNPVRLLGEISQDKLDAAAEDEGFLENLDAVVAGLRAYVDEKGWFSQAHPEAAGACIAYFCMEFGLTECLPIYSGGLGVLAGDHLKSASDLELPLVGVGLLYQQGYFTQRLNADGWQLEVYNSQDFGTLPVLPAVGEDGKPVRVEVYLAGRWVSVAVWRAQVGRVPLILLDTNVPENLPVDQDVTDELYGGGPEDRIRQEIVLGIGGMRALRALGYRPTVCHMNEGHSAFLSLEWARQLMSDHHLTYWEARQVVQASTVFTTHTPVPAGFDLFPEELMQKYFTTMVKDLGLEWNEFMGKGRVHPANQAEPFNVAALALRHAPRRNAVSRLHRRVTAHMLAEGWPGLPDSEIPVDSITNGVHMRGWVSMEMAELLDRYLGVRWQRDVSDPSVWDRIRAIPDEELWRTHERQRERLVAFARRMLRQQLTRLHASPQELKCADEALRTDILTVGFARRFATYKRATLLLREPERLKALLLNERMPVQIVFSGKAHPRDDAGKAFIRDLVQFAKQEGLTRRLVFLEDYDLEKARMLVRGADVWLNTPRRPLEASGTSGMKVLVNGGLNVSVLDGWWAEGFRQDAGWAVGDGEEYDDFEYQDRIDAASLFSLLENRVVPLFYQRGEDGLPREWIAWMKSSMRHLTAPFSTARMVKDYTERYYVPATLQHGKMTADECKRARELAAWKQKVRNAWSQVQVATVTSDLGGDVAVGGKLPLEVTVRLGPLTPDDVQVIVYYGTLRPDGSISGGRHQVLTWSGVADGLHQYRGDISASSAGSHGFQVAVVPHQDDILVPHEMSLMAWE